MRHQNRFEDGFTLLEILVVGVCVFISVAVTFFLTQA